jgi:putative nucleotidyltransferase with HDIG domain
MLKRITKDQLRLGMYIHALCGSWMEHPFWRLKFVLTDAADLQRIHRSGIAELWIDTERGLDVAGGLSDQDVAVQVERELAQALSSELPVEAPSALAMPDNAYAEAVQLRDKALRRMQSLFSEVRMGRSIHVEGCVSTVEDIIGSVGRHPGALISLLRLKTQDEYTYLHSVAVCTLLVALARTLGLAAEVVREVGVAGLLHDIGKARIPLVVLNKPAKLSDEEFALIKRHPEFGHALLTENAAASKLALDVCLHHHEKVDGSGYPHGLKLAQISLYAKMGAVCDVYDAVTSCRPYKDAWEPGEAVRQMAQWKGHFDPAVFQAFVKTVGIYPSGTLVRLKSQRLGVVLDQGGTTLLTPRVKVFHCAAKRQRLPHQVVDLSEPGCDDAIAGVESAAAWGFKHLNQLWLEAAGVPLPS